MLVIYIICTAEACRDITTTCDVGSLEVEWPIFESRIQVDILADGINGVLAALTTTILMSEFAQKIGVIALTRCANRKAGYCCADSSPFVASSQNSMPHLFQ
jgi:NCS2 family nucleobase:cation symporter-2